MSKRDTFVWGCAALLLAACSSAGGGSDDNGGAGAGSTSAGASGVAGHSAGAANTAGGAGAANGGAANSAGGLGGGGASSGGAPNAGAAGSNSAGSGGTVASAGTGGAGTSGSAGSSLGGTSGSAGSAGSDADTVTACLPSGQEKLVIKISGQPSLSVTTPSTLGCLSQFLPAQGTDPASLDLDWTTSDGTLAVVLRQDDVTPGKLGTFEPFAVVISQSGEGWLGLPTQCHVNLSGNDKIGEETHAGGVVFGIYKVAGKMTCDAGWALSKPNDTLDQFDFSTRVTTLQAP